MKPAGRAIGVAVAAWMPPAEFPGLEAPPFFECQKYHPPMTSSAAIPVGQIQNGSLDSSSGGGAARGVGLPGSGVAGPDRVGVAPVARVGCVEVMRCEMAPVGRRTCAEVGARGTVLVVCHPSVEISGIATGTAELIDSLNHPALMISRSEVSAASTFAGRCAGSALMSHITQSQIGCGTSGATDLS